MTSPIPTLSRAKPYDPQTEPVINNPYQFPKWHWQLNDYAIAIQDSATPGRRPAQITPPVAGSRVKTAGRGQAGILGFQFKELKLVNDIRAAVLNWQHNQNFAGVTATTRRLLEYWTDPEAKEMQQQSDLRPYFAQIDAVLTHIYLKEIQPPALTAQLAEINKKYNLGLDRIGHKMATGTGKTLAMAMIILWQAANHRRNPQDDRFTNRFLMLTPGITVKERLQASLNPRDTHSDFHEFPIAPPGDEWQKAIRHIQMDTANWQQFDPHLENNAPSGLARQLLEGGAVTLTDEEIANRRESPEDIIQRLIHKRKQDAHRILVFNDESHHCHRGDPDNKKEPVNTKWFAGLEMIRNSNFLLYATDFSATPTYIAQQNPRPVDWLVSDYSLLDAMEAGLVKIPQLPTALGETKAKAEWRDLYANSEPEEKEHFNPDEAGKNIILKEALQGLYENYSQLNQNWSERHARSESNGSAPIPVIAIIMNRVESANHMFQYIAEGKSADRLPLLSNALDETKPPNTILVHSQLESNEKEAQVPKAIAAAIHKLAERYRKHYTFPEKARPAAIMREVMNTVGKPGRPGEFVRCVISVDMLTEGWDTKTVTHLLGYRRFGASLLCEQAAGRTLRRVRHETNPEGLYLPEYAVVIGIPYPQYSAVNAEMPLCQRCGKKQCACALSNSLTVQSRNEYARYAVSWPNIARLERKDKISSLRLQPTQQPAETYPIQALPWNEETLIAPIGPELRLNNGQRLLSEQRFFYLMAEQAVLLLKQRRQEELQAENDEINLFTRTLFADALTAAKTLRRQGWIPDPPECSPWFPGDLNNLSQAAEWLLKALDPIPPTTPTSQVAMTARAALLPWRDTNDLKEYEVLPNPERIYGKAKKAQISYAHCDSSWEVKVAEQLDSLKSIDRWARNRRLNWYIPYVTEGQPRRYYPDFVAVVKLDDKHELNIVIEVKGQEDEDDRLKKRWTEDYWLPAVNSHPEYGAAAGKIWTYLYLDSQSQVTALEPLLAETIAQAQKPQLRPAKPEPKKSLKE